MLTEVKARGAVLREALDLLMDFVQNRFEMLPPKLLDLPEFVDPEVALEYLRNEVRPSLEEMIVVALWGEFEVMILDKALPMEIQAKNRELLNCMRQGKVTPRLKRFFSHVSPEELEKICVMGEKLWDFRSWIAHGRNPYESPDRWSPEDAYEFLKDTWTKVMRGGR